MFAQIIALDFPTLLMGGLLFSAALLYIVRSWDQTIAAIAAVLALLLAIWLWRLDLGDAAQTMRLGLNLELPLERMGFVFQLQSNMLPVLTLAFAMSAAAFLLAARVSQGRTFVPGILVLLAGYVAMILIVAGVIEPILAAPMFLVALSCVGVFVLQAGRLQHPAGPLRLMIPPLLAFPLFLIAKWYMDQIPLNPQESESLLMAGQLISAGLLLLMAPVPLHTAQPLTLESAPPVVGALVMLLYQLAVLFLYFRVTATFAVGMAEAPLGMWMRAAGLATAVWGGVAAAGTNHPGRLWGYAALHDWGLILMVLAIPSEYSMTLVLFLFALRAVSMFTAATGLSMLEAHVGSLDVNQLSGAGTRLPWNSAAFLVGGLGLVGFPLTAGFTGHWTALQLISDAGWQSGAAIMVAAGGVIFGFVRFTRLLFGLVNDPYLRRERPVGTLFAIAVLIISVVLAMTPQILTAPVTRAVLTFGG